MAARVGLIAKDRQAKCEGTAPQGSQRRQSHAQPRSPLCMHTCTHAYMRTAANPVGAFSPPSLCSRCTRCWVISRQVETLRGGEIGWNENCSGLVRKQPALQGAAAAATAAALPWQRRGEHVLESESQGYSISSCFNNIIPYERNITSLVSMMKIHIRSFQPRICPMNAENPPSRGTQENEWHVSRFH